MGRSLGTVATKPETTPANEMAAHVAAIEVAGISIVLLPPLYNAVPRELQLRNDQQASLNQSN